MTKYLKTSIVAFCVIAMVACSKSTKDSLQGSWKVSKLSMAGSEQDPELFGPFAYTFNEDGSYAYKEGAKNEAGKWIVVEEKQIQFTPENGEAYTKEVNSISKDSVVLVFKSFTMDVKHVLVK